MLCGSLCVRGGRHPVLSVVVCCVPVTVCLCRWARLSVYVSDTSGLPISVSVCLPPMCHHLCRCHRLTHRSGHRWVCRAHWCQSGACPIPPAMDWAGRLFARPAPGKHRDPEAKGRLPHLHPCPSACPGRGRTTVPQAVPPQLETCPGLPPPTVTSLPKPQPWPCPVCLSASLSVCAPLGFCWPLGFCPYFLSPGFSAALPFSGMALVFVLPLSLHLKLFRLSQSSAMSPFSCCLCLRQPTLSASSSSGALSAHLSLSYTL